MGPGWWLVRRNCRLVSCVLPPHRPVFERKGHLVSTLVRPQTTTIDGLSIRFAEGGAGSTHALLLSPWPESLLAFEQVWSTLTEVAHVVAVDLPGFGVSQRREELMNPKAMGEFIVCMFQIL